MKVSNKISIQIVKVSVIPILILVSLTFLYVVYSARLEEFLAENIWKISRNTFFIIITLFSAILFNGIITAIISWYGLNISGKTPTKLDDEFLPLFSKISKIILWTITGVIILSRLGVNISALIATLGVSSLAIALAAKDTIENLISGFLIMIDRPFTIGDTIRLPSGEKVTVLKIGARRSQFLGEDKTVIIVPNTDLSKSKIVNFTYGERIGA